MKDNRCGLPPVLLNKCQTPFDQATTKLKEFCKWNEIDRHLLHKVFLMKGFILTVSRSMLSARTIQLESSQEINCIMCVLSHTRSLFFSFMCTLLEVSLGSFPNHLTEEECARMHAIYKEAIKVGESATIMFQFAVISRTREVRAHEVCT